MKRDWECVRSILHGLQQQPPPSGTLLPRDVQGWDEQTVAEHMRLLDEDGLIDATWKDLGDGRLFAVAQRLTSRGHELIATLESKPVWISVRRLALDHGVELSLEAVKAFATKAIAEMLR